MGDVGTEVSTNDAMPGRVVLFVELLLDVGGNILLDIVLLERLGRAVHGVLLHLLGHVRVLYDGLPVRHLDLLFVYNFRNETENKRTLRRFENS